MRRHLPPGGPAAAEGAARRRRRSTARVATTTAANATSWTATARAQPSRAASDTSPSDGVAAQNSACHVASTDPPAKPGSVSTMGGGPAPRWKSVPDPQPPPSCIPMAKTNAPISTERLAGATAPPRARPKASPAARSGAKSTVATASISICARMPRPSPRVTRARKAAVKPKAAWYRTTPRAAPTRNSALCRAPYRGASQTAPTRSAAPTAPTTRGWARRGARPVARATSASSVAGPLVAGLSIRPKSTAAPAAPPGSAGGWWRVTITCYPRWSLARSRFPRWVRSGPRSGTGGDTDDELLARRGDDLDPGYGPEGGGGPARSGRDGDAPRAGRAPGLDGPDDPDAARARRRLRPAQPDLGPDPRARARRHRPTAVADPRALRLLGRLRDRRHDGNRGDGRAGNGRSDGDPHPVHSAPGDRRAHPGRGMAGRQLRRPGGPDRGRERRGAGGAARGAGGAVGRALVRLRHHADPSRDRQGHDHDRLRHDLRRRGAGPRHRLRPRRPRPRAGGPRARPRPPAGAASAGDDHASLMPPRGIRSAFPRSHTAPRRSPPRRAGTSRRRTDRG